MPLGTDVSVEVNDCPSVTLFESLDILKDPGLNTIVFSEMGVSFFILITV
jgi:hypothetical protein